MSVSALRVPFGWRPLTLILAAGLCSTAPGCTSEEDGDTGENKSGAKSTDDEDDESEDENEDEDAKKPDAGKTAAKDAGKSTPAPDAGKPAKDAGPGETKSSLWCDALPVFERTCGNCHGSELAAGAPMPLVDYDDFIADAPVTEGKKVWEVAKTRIHATMKTMPPSDPLQGEDLAAVDAWFNAGAPKPEGACADTGTDQQPPAETGPWPPEGAEDCYELKASGAGANVAPGTEPHPQFVFDAPWGADKVQALGFRPITDNKKVLHHWILYANSGFGFINGWAPGKDDSLRKPLPPDVGVQIPSGPQSLRLDVHYNNKEGAQMETDASGVEVCITRKLRPNAATTYMGFSQFLLSIPNGAKNFDVVGTCNVTINQPVFLLGESPHAHTLARHMKFYVKRGSEMIKLHDAPFDFDAQVSTPFDKPFELKNGDQVITTCTYDNDTGRTVTFGENTGNEMCFNFATYYPVGALSCGGGGGLGGLLGGGGGDISSIFGGGT